MIASDAERISQYLAEWKNKKVYLYGAANMGGIAYKLLNYYGCNVTAYITTTGGGICNGLQILSVNDLKPEDASNTVVILTLNPSYHADVKGLLLGRGFSNIEDSFDTIQILMLRNIFRSIFERSGIDLSGDIFQYGNFRMINPYQSNFHLDEFFLECGDILLPSLFQNNDWLTEGEYERKSVCVNPGDVVVDCGANIGLFSCVAASKGAKVYAFEPCVEQLGGILKRHSELYHGQIRHIPFALSDRSGRALFNITTSSQGSSYLEDTTCNQKVILEHVMVETVTLDKWVQDNGIDRIDFIKADIEGAERLMLAGAQDTLLRFAPKLSICTYHHPDDPQVLEGLIKQANPSYKVEHGDKKLYAWCEA